ncbi:uncharacterized protein MONOS_13858 [Monocercomonoides exilis]|uniref:uncharacterized protein n=1 Tax=Monocercomonoides exilis TaxID=2049356 RepID=UPI00355ABB69|nr:hypothetical protein MONOS_13858 [Monocercomonoides exilis]|eukprot:MONOS_13858.1-p1 / transcript=MONOS_13858.1 / gene=MONOS_13858 / organism=Monocercomonoides_exilis_PA203 / gene_product=unspecified product / transcript_product=unspecified product / location=Mono_scaffold00895:2236-2616(+) / protein_length=127 / sequence_SO=supercontig / SO=protein_coding / is_pseudo=false
MGEAEMNIEGEEEGFWSLCVSNMADILWNKSFFTISMRVAVTIALSAARVASRQSSRRLDYAAEGPRGCVENEMMEGVVLKDDMDREMEIEATKEANKEGMENTEDEVKDAESSFEGRVQTIEVSK